MWILFFEYAECLVVTRLYKFIIIYNVWYDLQYGNIFSKRFLARDIDINEKPHNRFLFVSCVGWRFCFRYVLFKHFSLKIRYRRNTKYKFTKEHQTNVYCCQNHQIQNWSTANGIILCLPLTFVEHQFLFAALASMHFFFF